MAVEQMVFLDPAKLPNLNDVQARAHALGYDLKFPEAADLRSHTGFLPAAVDEVATGFEHYFDGPMAPPNAPEGLGAGLSHAVVTRTGSDFRETLAATIFLRAVSDLTRGAYWYPGDEQRDHHEVGPYLDDQIAGMRSELARQEAKRLRHEQANLSPPPLPTPEPNSPGFFSRLFKPRG